VSPKKRRGPPPLNSHEFEIIAKYGEAFSELVAGMRKPKTPAQKHFLDACLGKVKPTTRHEAAFMKFLDWLQLERHGAEVRRFVQEGRGNAAILALEAVDEYQRRRASRPVVIEEGAFQKPTPEPPKRHRPRRRLESERSTDIPEFEEGYPRPGWFTDEDWKKLRSRYP
jgi:uncharacterized protein YifE (UPF0438 family)